MRIWASIDSMTCRLLNRFVEVPCLAHAIIVVVAMGSVGCKTTEVGLPEPLPDREARMEHGYLFYLDGAGGGTAKKNWAGGVKEGLLAAGFKGAGEMYSWEKGEGMRKDQDADLEYKRNMAKGMAYEIMRYRAEYPGAPIGIIGFSAGTAEGIFALELLPPGVQIDTMVLLGASISNDYDMTEALKHVSGKVYIYTSKKDKVLGVLMPMDVTADLKKVPGAGIDGFVMPTGATDETRSLYAKKIVTIPWNDSMGWDGDGGGHFDNVKMPFIRDFVAPHFIRGSSPQADSDTDADANAATGGSASL